MSTPTIYLNGTRLYDLPSNLPSLDRGKMTFPNTEKGSSQLPIPTRVVSAIKNPLPDFASAIPTEYIESDSEIEKVVSTSKSSSCSKLFKTMTLISPVGIYSWLASSAQQAALVATEVATELTHNIGTNVNVTLSSIISSSKVGNFSQIVPCFALDTGTCPAPSLIEALPTASEVTTVANQVAEVCASSFPSLSTILATSALALGAGALVYKICTKQAIQSPPVVQSTSSATQSLPVVNATSSAAQPLPVAKPIISKPTSKISVLSTIGVFAGGVAMIAGLIPIGFIIMAVALVALSSTALIRTWRDLENREGKVVGE